MTVAARTVRVDLGDRGYDVVIGAGVLAEAGARLESILEGRRWTVVTDSNVAAAHLEALSRALGGDAAARAVVVPCGEDQKSFAALESLCDALLDRGLGRGDVILAFGGGVIGDLAGFAAAILKRGVSLVQIPTTLLAQVDSSVGGKTAINARAGKNLIGAFHQPAAVLADTAVLDTLDRRELRAGFAEVIKTAAIRDADFFAWLEVNAARVLDGDGDARAEAVARCVAWKARIVAADETERGERALLNFGHTFGHAIEAETGLDGDVRHGEAVAFGMVMAADYAARIGRCGADVGDRLRALLAQAGLPTVPKDVGAFDADAFLARLRHDKKAAGGRLRLILPRAVGAADIVEETDETRLLAFLKDTLS